MFILFLAHSHTRLHTHSQAAGVVRVATKLLEAGASCVAQDKDGVSCAMSQCSQSKHGMSLISWGVVVCMCLFMCEKQTRYPCNHMLTNSCACNSTNRGRLCTGRCRQRTQPWRASSCTAISPAGKCVNGVIFNDIWCLNSVDLTFLSFLSVFSLLSSFPSDAEN